MNDIRTFTGTLAPNSFSNTFVTLLGGAEYTRVKILESWLDLKTSGASPSMPYHSSGTCIVVERDGGAGGPLQIKATGLTQIVEYFIRLEITP